jgi:hypothetical protein
MLYWMCRPDHTSEVMATAPLVVLLYDRAFVAGSFAEACAGADCCTWGWLRRGSSWVFSSPVQDSAAGPSASGSGFRRGIIC